MSVNNQQNSQDRRALDRQTAWTFRRVGQAAGLFDQIHGIAENSKNNVYLTENRGRRVHKFQPVSP
jgi:hypothetical protein